MANNPWAVFDNIDKLISMFGSDAVLTVHTFDNVCWDEQPLDHVNETEFLSSINEADIGDLYHNPWVESYQWCIQHPDKHTIPASILQAVREAIHIVLNADVEGSELPNSILYTALRDQPLSVWAQVAAMGYGVICEGIYCTVENSDITALVNSDTAYRLDIRTSSQSEAYKLDIFANQPSVSQWLIRQADQVGYLLGDEDAQELADKVIQRINMELESYDAYVDRYGLVHSFNSTVATLYAQAIIDVAFARILRLLQSPAMLASEKQESLISSFDAVSLD